MFTWAECVANFISIYGELFGVQHAANVAALNRFLAFVMAKGRIYQAAVCIQYALDAFDVNLSEMHNSNEWTEVQKDLTNESAY